MSRVVFVGNIPFEMSEEQIIDIFKEVGPVVAFRYGCALQDDHVLISVGSCSTGRRGSREDSASVSLLMLKRQTAPSVIVHP